MQLKNISTVWICVLINLVLGVFFARNVAEGYVTMIVIFYLAIFTGILSTILILVTKVKSTLIWALSYLLILELVHLITTTKIALFGIFNNNTVGLHNQYFVISISMLIAVFFVFGISYFRRLKH